MVDDAIVIVENSSYYIEQGFPPKEAAIKAMQELTGPVMGITLVLMAVFLPAAFLPGITGQIFRQFALVIASTAVISAINALTLKPVQCALWLKPRRRKRPNWFYRGFNRVFQAMTDVYMAIVSRMVHGRPDVVVFVVINASVWGVPAPADGLLPTEDQGYGILLARLPDGASLPRSQEVTRQDRRHPERDARELRSWVTIGGYSLLDGGQRLHDFARSSSSTRTGANGAAGLDQEKIVSSINRELAGLQEAQDLSSDPAADPGAGAGGRLPDDGGRPRKLGLAELQKAARELVQARQLQSSLRGLITTFSASSPQLYLDIDRTKARIPRGAPGNVFATLQTYLGSSYVNLFNKFNQVYQVYIQADSRYRLEPRTSTTSTSATSAGEMVPLGTLLDVSRSRAPS